MNLEECIDIINNKESALNENILAYKNLLKKYQIISKKHHLCDVKIRMGNEFADYQKLYYEYITIDKTIEEMKQINERFDNNLNEEIINLSLLRNKYNKTNKWSNIRKIYKKNHIDSLKKTINLNQNLVDSLSNQSDDLKNLIEDQETQKEIIIVKMNDLCEKFSIKPSDFEILISILVSENELNLLYNLKTETKEELLAYKNKLLANKREIDYYKYYATLFGANVSERNYLVNNILEKEFEPTLYEKYGLIENPGTNVEKSKRKQELLIEPINNLRKLSK